MKLMDADDLAKATATAEKVAVKLREMTKAGKLTLKDAAELTSLVRSLGCTAQKLELSAVAQSEC